MLLQILDSPPGFQQPRPCSACGVHYCQKLDKLFSLSPAGLILMDAYGDMEIVRDKGQAKMKSWSPKSSSNSSYL